MAVVITPYGLQSVPDYQESNPFSPKPSTPQVNYKRQTSPQSIQPQTQSPQTISPQERQEFVEKLSKPQTTLPKRKDYPVVSVYSPEQYKGEPHSQSFGSAIAQSWSRKKEAATKVIRGVFTGEQAEVTGGFSYGFEPFTQVSRKDVVPFGTVGKTFGEIEQERREKLKKENPVLGEYVETYGVTVAQSKLASDISKETLPKYQSAYESGVFTKEQAQKEYEKEVSKRYGIATEGLGSYAKPASIFNPSGALDLTYKPIQTAGVFVGTGIVEATKIYATGGVSATEYVYKGAGKAILGTQLSTKERLFGAEEAALGLGLSIYGASSTLKGVEAGYVSAGQSALQEQGIRFGEVQAVQKGGKSFVQLYGERSAGGLTEKISLAGQVRTLGKNKFIMPVGRGTSIITGDLSFLSKGGESVKVLAGQEFILGQKGTSFVIKEGQLFGSLSTAKTIPIRGLGTIYGEVATRMQVLRQLGKSATTGGKVTGGEYLSVSKNLGNDLYLSRGGKLTGIKADIINGRVTNIDFISRGESFGLTKVIKTTPSYDFYPSGKELLLKGNIPKTATQSVIQENLKTISAVKNIPKIVTPSKTITSFGLGGTIGAGTILQKPSQSPFYGTGLYERTEGTIVSIPRGRTGGGVLVPNPVEKGLPRTTFIQPVAPSIIERQRTNLGLVVPQGFAGANVFKQPTALIQPQALNTGQLQKQELRLRQRQIFQNPFIQSTSSFGSLNIPKKTPFLFPVGFPSFGFGGEKKGLFDMFKQPQKYEPSLTAGILGIKGKKPKPLLGQFKFGYLPGIRPLAKF